MIIRAPRKPVAVLPKQPRNPVDWIRRLLAWIKYMDQRPLSSGVTNTMHRILD